MARSPSRSAAGEASKGAPPDEPAKLAAESHGHGGQASEPNHSRDERRLIMSLDSKVSVQRVVVCAHIGLGNAALAAAV